MHSTSKLLLYPLVLGPAVLVAAYLLLLGPLGWAAGAALVLAGMAYTARRGDGSDEDTGPDRTNCAACGSPNPADSEACGYCGDPL
jgi:hypothetical protein